MSLRIKRRLSVVAMASFVLTSASGVVMSAEESDADSALIFSDRGSDSGYYADQYDPGDGQDDPVEENGAVETFTERYPNGKVKIERQVTLDTDGNYVNHGAWKMYNAAGKVVAEGQFALGRRVGIWSRWHDRNDSKVFTQAPFNRFQAPFLSQANFTGGQLDGEWIIYDSAQLKCSQVSIRNGKRHGLAVVWTTNGKILRQSSYDQGVPVGDVLQLNPQSGDVGRAATYVKGRQVVSKATNYNRGGPKKTQSQYLAPKTVEISPDDYWNVRFAEYETQGEHLRHGPSQAWHSNGQLQLSGKYDYDKRVGHFVYWHPNGQKAAEGEFANDVEVGTWVWWHENGQKAAIGQYDAGSLVGRWRWWNENGRLTKQTDYDRGSAVAAEEEEDDRVDVGSADDVELRF